MTPLLTVHKEGAESGLVADICGPLYQQLVEESQITQESQANLCKVECDGEAFFIVDRQRGTVTFWSEGSERRRWDVR